MYQLQLRLKPSYSLTSMRAVGPSYLK